MNGCMTPRRPRGNTTRSAAPSWLSVGNAPRRNSGPVAGDSRLGAPQMLFLNRTRVDASTAAVPGQRGNRRSRIASPSSPGGPDAGDRVDPASRGSGSKNGCSPSAGMPPRPINCASALGILVMSNPRLGPEQFAFLVSRLAPTSDAVLRQTAARVIAARRGPRAAP